MSTELEAAHEAVLEAESKMSGMRKRGGQKRLDEALAAEQAVLDRVGFPTWSSYVMGAGLLAIDPVAEQRLERARAELATAETHWAAVAADIEANPDHRALLDRLEDVYLEAFDLLGGDDDQEDLEQALRSLRVPKREVTTDELVDALAYQLELVGLDLGPNPGVDRTIMAADAFLGEVRSSERAGGRAAGGAGAGRRPAQRRSRRPGRGRRHPHHRPDRRCHHGAGRGRPRCPAGRARPRPPPTRPTTPMRSRLAWPSSMPPPRSKRCRRVGSCASPRSWPTSRSASPRRRPSEPAFDVTSSESDAGPESIEFYLLARLAAQRTCRSRARSPWCSTMPSPDSAPSSMHSLLAKLERMSESVQIIYLSDDPW